MTTSTNTKCPLCAAAESYVEGTDVKAHAASTGMPVGLLRQRLGLGGKRNNWTDENKQRFQDMLDEGATIAELANHWGVTRSQVNNLIAKWGLDPTVGETARRQSEGSRAILLAELAMGKYVKNPEVTLTKLTSWLNKNADLSEAVTEAQVDKMFKAFGLELDRSDEQPVKAADKATPYVEDVKLPEPEDDVVEVASVTLEDWVVEYLRIAFIKEETPTLEGFAIWSAGVDGPTSGDVRKARGSWANMLAHVRSTRNVSN